MKLKLEAESVEHDQSLKDLENKLYVPMKSELTQREEQLEVTINLPA